MFHLNVRVAWHDNRWNGSVCKDPAGNSFCMDLKRIRQERIDEQEVEVAGKWFDELPAESLPPCRAESAAFMNERAWVRKVEHPYQSGKKTTMTHGHLEPTDLKVGPYSSFAVPFYWMLRDHQGELEESLPIPLPPDEEPPFKSPWVFSAARQEALSEWFFGRIEPGKSLVFLYTKSGHPLDENYPRLLVGIGRINKLSKVLKYDTQKEGETYPIWDRLFEHSIRPDGSEGFILPYHDYLEPTGDPAEDQRRMQLLDEIAVVPEQKDMMAFSYAGEHAGPEVALSALTKCLESVRKIRGHGIAEGPWERREDWLNDEIARCWEDRGAFPGTGAALEAIGMRLGTSLMLELLASGEVKPTDNPWPIVDAVLKGDKPPPHKAYAADIQAVAGTWAELSDERRELLHLLSRFSLSAEQARRWFIPKERNKATRMEIGDAEILANPFRIAELDLGSFDDKPVALATIDRGMLPDSTIAANHPLPDVARVESALDWRRVRAALVHTLRAAAEEGDTLLSEDEALTRLDVAELERPVAIPPDWLSGNEDCLKGEIERLKINSVDGESIPCIQLQELQKGEKKLAKILGARAKASLEPLQEQWQELLIQTVEEGGDAVDLSNPRHAAALDEQARALEAVTSRKLSVLVGSAGTGKTTVLGALLRSEKLQQDGILFLAPTGKARVRLSQKAGAEAMTVAQFLYSQKRYDGLRQRVLLSGGKEPRQAERTVVIDECSMLTMNDLLGALLALDLAHVQRVILVGDPNQLPPIGEGRPFADLVAWLDELNEAGDSCGSALARLTVELRTTAGAPSDTLKLASWYTRTAQPVDADRVIGDITAGEELNDLKICYWSTPNDLYERLEEQFMESLRLESPHDVEGFNAALGLTKEGWVPFDDHDGCENFQILSPVRLNPHGVHELNRWAQITYRGKQLGSSRSSWGLSLGEEEIVWGDKIIRTRNGKMDGWDGKNKQVVKDVYLANGEIGVAGVGMGKKKNKALDVAFAQRPDVRFAFWRKNFSSDNAPLELAYALTVHKAQGSEFSKVFVVLPKRCRVLSRELLYTALTRSRDQLILMVEGEDAGALFDLAKPDQSETARRNTNLFEAGLRVDPEEFPYAAHLVHHTTRGELVQSKSELAIANYLHQRNLDYKYNRPLTIAGRKLFPDFSFIDDAGELFLWEHLGMLHREDYREGWEWKKAFYEKNGFVEGENLLTTAEGPGLDMQEIEKVADKIEQLIG